MTCPQGEGDPNGYAAAVYLYAANLILEQTAGPSVSNVGGALADAATVEGTSDVDFSATDPGAGVYEAVFTVDGEVVQSTVVNGNGGRCRNVGETTDGLPAFLYVQPCPQSVSAEIGLDTAGLSNGAHHLVVSVLDAAGNSAQVLNRTVTVDNPPPPGSPNGTNATAQARLSLAWEGARGERLASAFDRAHTIVGRLTTPGGAPISGATIEAEYTPTYAGGRPVDMPAPRTGPQGAFSVHVPAGVCSRTIRFSYRSHVGEAAPSVTAALTLAVHAGLSLAISPRTTSVGRTIHFTGWLLGGPVPAAGKALVLEARSPGGPWLEFDVVRSNAHGRYRASYRFKFPGPAYYQFRVLSEPEADYPFASGSSKIVGVVER